MRILIADDEAEITRALQTILERNHYTVDAVGSGREALDYLAGIQYDCAVLDVMMPGVDGLEVLRCMREGGDRTPVLLLTAKSTVADRVEGLDAGADDYLPKPFASQELLARLRALLRRRPTEYAPAALCFGDVRLEPATGELCCGAQRVRLCRKEYQVMEQFLRAPQTPLSARRLMERVWAAESEAGVSVVWVNIAYLRRKLEQLGSRVSIRSVRGIGYLLEETPC